MRLGGLSAPMGAVYYILGEVICMTVKYAILYMLMLPVGITLTIITILRMRSGKITLPKWAKMLLVVGMILSQVILAAAMMPPAVYQARHDTLVNTDTHSVTPIASMPRVDPDSNN